MSYFLLLLLDFLPLVLYCLFLILRATAFLGLKPWLSTPTAATDAFTLRSLVESTLSSALSSHCQNHLLKVKNQSILRNSTTGGRSAS